MEIRRRWFDRQIMTINTRVQFNRNMKHGLEQWISDHYFFLNSEWCIAETSETRQPTLNFLTFSFKLNHSNHNRLFDPEAIGYHNEIYVLDHHISLRMEKRGRRRKRREVLGWEDWNVNDMWPDYLWRREILNRVWISMKPPDRCQYKSYLSVKGRDETAWMNALS